MSGTVVWIFAERMSEATLRRLPVVVVQILCVGARDLRLRERGIDLQSFRRGSFRLGIGIDWSQNTECAEHAVRVGESGVRQRIRGIFCNRLFVIPNTLLERVECAALPEVSAAQVELIRLEILRVTAREALVFFTR